MALLVLIKSQAKTNCKQVPEQCPSNVRANSYSVEQRLEELNPYHVNGDPMWQVFVSVQKFIRTKFCRVPCKRG